MEINQTVVSEFLLLGFQNKQHVNVVLFILFFPIYAFTLVLNLLIVSLVVKVPGLRSPMYFFLGQLSVADVLVTTNITPEMLRVIINVGSNISVAGCITQLQFHCLSAAAECLLLTVMSYDQYVAICVPLHYAAIMNLSHCLHLSLCSWILSCTVSLVLVSLIYRLVFCGPYVIDHYFCDFYPLLELTCSDSTIVEMTDMIFSIPFVILPFFFILFTYISIFIAISRISTTSGKQKAFSTCSSHLIVVSTYYGTLITIYMAPSKDSTYNVNKVASLLYTMGTPFFNPIVYCLRNQDIRKALRTYIGSKKCYFSKSIG